MMNLKKLFEMQKVLDDRIVKEKGLEGVDLLPMKILALQTELGECANEWRGFKFWSEDQKARDFVPNPDDVCKVCDGQGMLFPDDPVNKREFCDMCDGCGVHFHNPLLEEYVDCLHFILSIGLELGIETPITESYWICDEETVTDQFRACFMTTTEEIEDEEKWFSDLYTAFNAVGRALGFTTEEIEQAYLDKNKVNHERQANGY